MSGFPKEQKPRDPSKRAELDALLEKLWALPADDVERAAALYDQVLQFPFKDAALPRNKGADGAFQSPNVQRLFDTPTQLEALPGGKVQVTFDTTPPTVRIYDQVITSFGQDPSKGIGELRQPGAA